MSDDVENLEPDLKASLLGELVSLRREGFWDFRGRDYSILTRLCGPPQAGESPQIPIQRRLLDLLDPTPVDHHGHELPRTDLGTRDANDPGLFGRVLFGEPGKITIEQAGNLALNPRERDLARRYEDLAALLCVTPETVRKGPKAREPRGGPAHRLMMDLVDGLLSTSPPNSVRATARDAGAVTILPDRAAFADFAIRQLAGGETRSLRMTLTGPWLLHTDTHYERMESDRPGRHMERALRDFVRRIGDRRASDVRLILRNSPRYALSAKRYVAASEWDAFVDHVQQGIDEVWGANGGRGPDICCYNTGIASHFAVFDEHALVAYRTREDVRMTYPQLLEHGPAIVAMRREQFDGMFDDNSEGQIRELEKLRDFVDSLRSVVPDPTRPFVERDVD